MKFTPSKTWSVTGLVFTAVVGISCGSQVDFSSVDGDQVNNDQNTRETNLEVADTGPGPSAIIEADPLFQSKLEGARFQTAGWRTDFSRHTVVYEDILSGGVGRDGIPPIDRPRFETIEEAESVIDDLEPVVTFEVNGEAKAGSGSVSISQK